MSFGAKFSGLISQFRILEKSYSSPRTDQSTYRFIFGLFLKINMIFGTPMKPSKLFYFKDTINFTALFFLSGRHAIKSSSGQMRRLLRMLQLTTPENTITYHNTLYYSPKMLHKHCLQFLLGVKMVPRETENNAYAKFWGDKLRALWYVMVFSGVINMNIHQTISWRRDEHRTHKHAHGSWILWYVSRVRLETMHSLFCITS